MSAKEFRAKYRCATIMPIEVKQNAPIYLLAKKRGARESEYLVITWNMRLATSLQKSQRVAKLNPNGTIIYGPISCKDEAGSGNGKGKGKGGKGKHPQGNRPGSSGQEQNGEDGFIFYPEPVPPMPEKNYGPLFEGPIVMPERQ
jgi:hypothetical protein